MLNRRRVLGLAAAALSVSALPAVAASPPANPTGVMTQWYRLVLELIRHTATQTPPVASRAMAYVGVTIYESLATGNPAMTTLAGQLNDLTPTPTRPDALHDEALVVHGAMTAAIRHFFGNTGPTGQRAMNAVERQLTADLTAGLPADVVDRSLAHGQAVAAHIIAWAATDGGANVENMGFPLNWTLTQGPSHWVPTSKVALQQAPLLPDWGKNRPFAMPKGMDMACGLPAPPEYSEDPASEFFLQAKEVYDTSLALTDQQKAIARFWSDDPMLSSTPPGHWLYIVVDLIKTTGMEAPRAADLLARIGVSVADAFIACWASKVRYDLLRPITYIKRVIDPKWEPLLNTPPFPEYPSGHSTQSGAAAVVLTAFFGEGYSFLDTTNADEGMKGRDYPSFMAAAEEAGISRLYGGIHFRAAIEAGLRQGYCTGAYTVALRTL
ncbi:MAG: vanadium-dependent haloperoxidase [Pseudomonadota bacterium]